MDWNNPQSVETLIKRLERKEIGHFFYGWHEDSNRSAYTGMLERKRDDLVRAAGNPIALSAIRGRGARKVTGFMRGKEIDLTANVAAEYRYKARNLIAIIEVYERLHAPAEASADSASPSSSPTLPVSLRN
jgi:hypothetical protein